MTDKKEVSLAEAMLHVEMTLAKSRLYNEATVVRAAAEYLARQEKRIKELEQLNLPEQEDATEDA